MVLTSNLHCINIRQRLSNWKHQGNPPSMNVWYHQLIHSVVKGAVINTPYVRKNKGNRSKVEGADLKMCMLFASHSHEIWLHYPPTKKVCQSLFSAALRNCCFSSPSKTCGHSPMSKNGLWASSPNQFTFGHPLNSAGSCKSHFWSHSTYIS